MSYNFSETVFPSADGKSTVYAELYTPRTVSSRGIIQLSHGMIDYVGRYRELADYLTDRGYILAGNHHLGHGKTAPSPEDFGYFAERDGTELVLKDLHTMNSMLRHTFPTLPLILFGHSMGSFLARLYVVKYPNTVKGAVIHGTAGPNPALPAGKLLAKLVRAMNGSHYRSGLLKSLSIGAYQKKFGKEGPNAWLTRDSSQVADHDDDKYSNFDFTASGYIDLFDMLQRCNSSSWYAEYPKSLPTLIMSGDRDPVGSFGKGPRHVYKSLLVAGCESVTLKAYEGARHELFKETCREEVFSDLVGWLDGVVAKCKF